MTTESLDPATFVIGRVCLVVGDNEFLCVFDDRKQELYGKKTFAYQNVTMRILAKERLERP
jgi:hypothetical protein